jgi:glycosyltransferase involved in cell wall biosynthesis
LGTLNPEISVVMPCHNGAAYLARSTESVRTQTRADWELIIVDDGSKDDSWLVIQQIAATDPRIRPLRQSQSGAAAARNNGLSAARGRWVAFLDADDTWHPDFLCRMSAALAGRRDEALAYCGWHNVGAGHEGEPPFVPPDYETPDKLADLLCGCRWPIHGVMVSLDAIRRHGAFDPTLHSSEDFDLWLRLGCSMPLVRVPEVLACYHFHAGEQITKNRLRVAADKLFVQRRFLATHPLEAKRLGRAKVREQIEGDMLYRAYENYWKGDLPMARQLFRAVMASGYGNAKDWFYMLPSLLPMSLHRALVRTRRGQSATESQKPLS